MQEKWKRLVLCGVFSFLSATARGQHMGDIWIGRSPEADGRQIRIAAEAGGFNPADPLGNLTLLAPTSGFFEGWSSDSPGFDAIRTPSPLGEVYPLDAGADIWLDVVSLDAAFIIVVPPAYDILDAPGQSAHLGDRQLHKHLIWLVDRTDPAFNPAQCVWLATFRLRDAGTTAYRDSEPFTIRFATAPVSPADFDCDGDVDVSDFSAFQACFNGPGRPPGAETCRGPDLDLDGDIDVSDFSIFQACFNGPGRPPACP